MNATPRWDWLSMLLYILVGVIGAVCTKYVNERCTFRKCKLTSRSSFAYVIWFVIWVVFATWRYVGSHIGGMDATAYIQYFDVCLNPKGYWFADHVDLLYRVINKIIRLFTNDYHILFFILYGLIVSSYIIFVENFRFKHMNYAPLLLVVYIYTRSFNTLRTSLGIACVLLSLVYLKKNKYGKAVLLAIASTLFQVASLIYAGFLLFYYMYKKRNVKIQTCIIWILCASVIGRLGQYIIGNYDVPFLSHGVYRWYAVYSQVGQTFFTNYWKISFTQIVLGLTMAMMWKPLKREISSRDSEERNRLEFLRLICIYDVILIPVTYILNIWRGYEYLYIARLLMWAELIPLISRRVSYNGRMTIKIGSVLLFIGWLIFRMYNTWEDSGLMPYLFRLFG